MCGRFTLHSSTEQIRRLFRMADPPEIQPRYNISPSQPLLAVRLSPETGEREWAFFRWGLVPFWAQDASIGNRMINARAETAASSKAFTHAFQRRRCLIPASGFYEWRKVGNQKQPYYIYRKDGRPFALAALWERNERLEEPIESCTIITTDANELLKPIHDRMPVILLEEQFEDWLNAPNAQAAQSLLRPCPPDELACHPISRMVNQPKNDDPRLLEEVEPVEQSELWDE